MNEQELVQFLKRAAEIRFSESRKKAGRERLLALMRENPLPAADKISGWLDRFRPHGLAFSGIAALVVLIAGGGVSLAAEGSLPGEELYAFKTNVNERLLEKLSFSSQAKAEWEAKLLERRITEADELILEGKIDRIVFEESDDEASEALEEGHASGIETEDEERARRVRSAFEYALRGGDNIRIEVSGNRMIIREINKQKNKQRDEKRERESKDDEDGSRPSGTVDREDDEEDGDDKPKSSDVRAEKKDVKEEENGKADSRKSISGSSQVKKENTEQSSGSDQGAVFQTESEEDDEDRSGEGREDTESDDESSPE